jgi:hypothetical protein
MDADISTTKPAFTDGSTTPAIHTTVVAGTVTFPSTLDTDLGCGPGVSVVAVSLAGGGGIVACLDDLHGHDNAPPFPIWGTVRLP